MEEPGHLSPLSAGHAVIAVALGLSLAALSAMQLLAWLAGA